MGNPEMGAQFTVKWLQDESTKKQIASATAELQELDKHQGLIIPITWAELSLSSRARADSGAEMQNCSPENVGFTHSPCPGASSSLGSPADSLQMRSVLWMGFPDGIWDVQMKVLAGRAGDFNLYRLCPLQRSWPGSQNPVLCSINNCSKALTLWILKFLTLKEHFPFLYCTPFPLCIHPVINNDGYQASRVQIK